MRGVAQRPGLAAQGTRVHFSVAVALAAVIPALTLLYLQDFHAGGKTLATGEWIAAGLGIAGCMAIGLYLLGRYPRTIIRLRAYLQDVVAGELPDAIDLSMDEQDITAIETALNTVLETLRARLHTVRGEKARLEEELFRTRKLESIGTLAAGMAHEINTPLQYVSNNIQFIEKACAELLDLSGPDAVETNRAYLAAELPRAFGQAGSGIARIADIVRTVRAFASGAGDEERVPTDLNAEIETTIAVTRNEWKYSARIETRLAPDLPPVVCFPAEIKQTVMHLILNAAQAIEARPAHPELPPGQIRIETRQVAETLELTVADNGTGIPDALRERVFDPFFTTREVGTGHGFGLAFAHAAIVQRHGGRIHFASDEGEGTVFTVTLPLAGRDWDGQAGGRMT